MFPDTCVISWGEGVVQRRAEVFVAEISLSALCSSYKSGPDSKVLNPQTQCGWPVQVSSQTVTGPPAISGHGSVTDASILACVKLCGGLVKSTNSCNGSHEEDEKEAGIGPIFRRTTTLCYLLSESWPSQQIKPFLSEKGFKRIVTLQAKLFSWLLNDTSPYLSFVFCLSPGL